MNNILRSVPGWELTPEAALEFQRHRWARINACEFNLKEFCRTYFPQYFYATFSSMHNDLFLEIQQAIGNNQADNLAFAAPRGSAKSSIVSFALPLWAALYKKKHYIIIVSDTADQAN